MAILHVPKKLRAEVDRILSSDDPKWIAAELAKSLEITVEHVVRIAALLRRAEELEMEISLYVAPLPFLRKIAWGQMLPELFCTLQGNVLLLEKASALPIPDQEKVAANKPMKVMELGGDHRLVPPLDMSRREINQVFARGKIRSDGEQVGWLRDRMAVEAAKQAPTGDAEIKPDYRRRGVVISAGGQEVFLPVKDLARWLADIEGKR